MVVYAQPDDEERFWLLLLTVISPRKLDGIWFNRDSEGFYSSGDRCKIFWKKNNLTRKNVGNHLCRHNGMLQQLQICFICGNNCMLKNSLCT